MRGLETAGLSKDLNPIRSRPATDDELALVHDRAYIDLVKRELTNVTGVKQLSTGDTDVTAGSLAAARAAAGGVLNAVDNVMSGRLKNAFCAVRPPGHHATRNRGMGFCIFNNVAIAARYLQKMHGIGRVLIVDFDYHHGNGTQDIFYEDDSVFYFSTHHYGAYPGTGSAAETGAGKGVGTTLNVPLPPGAGDADYRGVRTEACSSCTAVCRTSSRSAPASTACAMTSSQVRHHTGGCAIAASSFDSPTNCAKAARRC